MAKTKESLKTQIYNAILNSIFSGEFKPGQILNEKELVEKFGCSKAPVREALIALCSDNVLRSFLDTVMKSSALPVKKLKKSRTTV